nr:FlgD immunoglobulin-like domain containing protein [Candidatus Krumholzibacteria bacterium]
MLIISVLALSLTAQADTAPELLWQRSWNGLQDYSDVAHKAAVDVDGSVVVLGSSHTPTEGQRAVLQRYSADGALLWTRIFPDLGGTSLTDLDLDTDGSVVFPSLGIDTQLGHFLSLTKVDVLGNTVWERRTYGNIVGFISANSRLSRDGDGNWCTYVPLNNSDILLMKVDPAGEVLWDRILDAGGTELPSDITFGTDGSIYLAGIQSPDFNLSARYSAEGDSLWAVLDPVEVFSLNVRVAPMSDGGAVFTSNDEMEVLGIAASFTWRMDAEGNILWRGRFPEPMEIDAVDVAEMLVTDDGRTVVLGSGGTTATRFHAQCFDDQGQELWVASAAGTGSANYMYAADISPSGLIVAGGSDNPVPPGSIIFLAGFAPDGEVAWTQSWNRTPGMPDRLADVAVGPDGSFAAVGHSWTGLGNGGDQWVILKFAAPLSAAEDIPAPFVPSVKAYPNPFNPMTRIRYTVRESGPVHLAVFDLAGRRVRTLVHRDHVPGQHELVWYGRDDAGQAQVSGTYLLMLETSAGVESSRVALVR